MSLNSFGGDLISRRAIDGRTYTYMLHIGSVSEHEKNRVACFIQRRLLH